ncbi:MBL fold metallo-hydrolase [Priestia megaterium]|nr:MBL fold metallo-hydrolase [Priestia megaterium]
MKEQLYKLVLPTPFAVGDVNVYIVKGQSVTLIDAGVKTKEGWEAFIRQLAQLGLSITDIDQVVLTHHHPDHVGLLDFFDHNVRVIGHEKNEPWISQDPSFFTWYDQFFEKLFERAGVDKSFQFYLRKLRASLKYSCKRSLTSSVKEGDKIDGLTDWRVLEVPGHAQSHIALYHENNELLIGGDLLLHHISSNPLIEPPINQNEPRAKSLLQYNNSLKRLLELPISCVYAGHGQEVTNVHELVEERLTKQRDRAMKILQLLKHQPLTAFDICKELFPAVYEKELGLTMSETIGQLDFLEERGEIDIEEGNHLVYSARA